ncbi:LacI family DNA-binding transcriptional regulator [Sphingomonas koreensis]|nr:LacI family DNA-binding transcriptional regulator [Sphingomonas koreensis]
MKSPASASDRPQRATIRDVSRVAGVSIKTVSRVLNNEKYVGEKTRRRIEAAMAELQFHPSSAARALGGHRSFQVALICDNPNPWYVYEVQYGTRVRCEQDKVRMIAQPYDRNSPTLLDDIVMLIDQVHPDGLILTPPVADYDHVLDELLRRGVAFARISPGTRLDCAPSAYIDNEQAAFDMTHYLIGLGHRRIGFVVGHRGYATSGQRLNGHIRALSDAGLEIDLGLVRQAGFDFQSGQRAVDELLDLPDPPTAIFASSDDMAAGALASAHRRGLSVPDALSVAGFDDSPVAQIVWPMLTTVRQPVRALAAAAADLLLAGGEPSRRLQLDYQLIVRGSAGPAPR